MHLILVLSTLYALHCQIIKTRIVTYTFVLHTRTRIHTHTYTHTRTHMHTHTNVHRRTFHRQFVLAIDVLSRSSNPRPTLTRRSTFSPPRTFDPPLRIPFGISQFRPATFYLPLLSRLDMHKMGEFTLINFTQEISRSSESPRGET